jgi:hypothetical protein
MLALTLKHPWPFAICHLGKRIENRTWFPSQTQLKVGDWFAIHGGKVPNRSSKDWEAAMRIGNFLRREIATEAMPHGRFENFMPGIVALAKFGGNAEEQNLEADFWFEGPCGWLLSEVRVLFEAIPMRGAQGLWTLPSDVAKQLASAIGEVV